MYTHIHIPHTQTDTEYRDTENNLGTVAEIFVNIKIWLWWCVV